jgi:hypothetical protein
MSVRLAGIGTVTSPFTRVHYCDIVINLDVINQKVWVWACSESAPSVLPAIMEPADSFIDVTLTNRVNVSLSGNR